MTTNHVMRHAYPNRHRTGKVHAIPWGTGNVRALCGMLPHSGTLNRDAGDRGRWYSTPNTVDCRRCLSRMEAITTQVVAQETLRSFEYRYTESSSSTSRRGVCGWCGRVHAVRKDGTMSKHQHQTRQAWKPDDTCLGSHRGPRYWAVPNTTEE